jgi:hypothetical protein
MQQGLIRLSDLASRLAPALGEGRSAEVVVSAARAAGLMAPTLSVRDALLLLDTLARAPGIVGTAARYARQRFDSEQPVDEVDEPQSPSSRPKIPRPHGRIDAAQPAIFPFLAIVRWFVPSLGDERVREEVLASMQRVSLSPDAGLTQAEALAVLEDLAASPGVVGATARFAKAHLLLRK